MTPLGKALVFYLRYPAEMGRLCGELEEPDLTGLPDADRVREMAEAVGAAASHEAADFLMECAEKVKDHFTGLGIVNLAKEAKRFVVLKNWGWYVNVRATSVQGGWFQCGVTLYDQQGIIAPWLWRQGGRAWEEFAKQRLGERVHSLAGEGVVWSGGTVALARIPILAGNEQGEDVDRDALVAKVVNAFSSIQAADVEAISRNVGDEDEPPESDEADPEEK